MTERPVYLSEVMVINTRSIYFGRVGTVMLVSTWESNVNLRFDAGTIHYCFGLHELEIL